MCECKKGWSYQAEGNYKLNDDKSSSINYVLFNVLFDDKIITTRILDEFPSEEESLNMMCNTKFEFLRSLGKNTKLI